MLYSREGFSRRRSAPGDELFFREIEVSGNRAWCRGRNLEEDGNERHPPGKEDFPKPEFAMKNVRAGRSGGARSLTATLHYPNHSHMYGPFCIPG